MANHSVLGIYKSKSDAGAAVEQLYQRGFRDENMSLLMSEGTYSKEFDIQKHNKGAEGLAAGATIGGAIGAIAAGLTAVGAVALTGGAGIVAAGPLVAALAGGGAGAATGGAIGGLIGLGFDEHEAKLVDEQLNCGRVLLAVDVPEQFDTDPVKKLMESSGAENVTIH